MAAKINKTTLGNASEMRSYRCKCPACLIVNWMHAIRLGQPDAPFRSKSLAHSQHAPLAKRTCLSSRGRNPGSLLQFWRFVSDAKIAKRYFVSGMVQGVGFRYFTQAAAERLRIHGIVRNLRASAVEVVPTAGPHRHAQLLARFAL